jgi:hypothetical protein
VRLAVRLFATLLVVVASVLCAGTAEARGPRRLFQGRASATVHHARPPIDARELYPQYYGGFHARALQNIGIPTGDIGIRGNGIYANPW